VGLTISDHNSFQKLAQTSEFKGLARIKPTPMWGFKQLLVLIFSRDFPYGILSAVHARIPNIYSLENWVCAPANVQSHDKNCILSVRIIPLLDPLTENYPPVPLFSNLSAENSLQEQDSTFTLSYSCVQRTINKPALAFIVSVSVADYAFIMGAYNLVIIVAGGIQKRKRKDGTFPILSEENTNNIRKSLPRMYRRGKQRAAVYSRNYSFTSSDIWLK
jgi:hypothetical protein